jgi:hypothetical protein
MSLLLVLFLALLLAVGNGLLVSRVRALNTVEVKSHSWEHSNQFLFRVIYNFAVQFFLAFSRYMDHGADFDSPNPADRECLFDRLVNVRVEFHHGNQSASARARRQVATDAGSQSKAPTYQHSKIRSAA